VDKEYEEKKTNCFLKITKGTKKERKKRKVEIVFDEGHKKIDVVDSNNKDVIRSIDVRKYKHVQNNVIKIKPSNKDNTKEESLLIFEILNEKVDLVCNIYCIRYLTVLPFRSFSNTKCQLKNVFFFR